MKKKVKLSKGNQSVLQAFEKGYKINEDGNPHYTKGFIKTRSVSGGYLVFTVRVFINDRSYCTGVRVHRLQAYQKFGNVIFTEGVCVRHKDGNCKNNSIDNIILGTHSDNMMDKSPEIRMRDALNATSFVKKHNHEEIVKMHNEGLSYGKIMEKTGIKSKGTISFIIKESMASRIN